MTRRPSENSGTAGGSATRSRCGRFPSVRGRSKPITTSCRGTSCCAALTTTNFCAPAILTFHVEGLFRTPPGWNLWVGGSPNRPKDWVYPLTGIVETDWAPFTFTMNWQITRAYRWVGFEAGEPFCFFFPVQRGFLNDVSPNFASMEANPELLEQFRTWSRSRDAFHAQTADTTPQAPSDKWQKHYYRGVNASDRPGAADHQAKLRRAPFDHRPQAPALRAGPTQPAEPQPTTSRPAMSTSTGADQLALKKREWLLGALERHRQLSPESAEIERRRGLSRQEFLERYYAAARPVILVGEMTDWPASSRWTPAYLREAIGPRLI